MVCQDQVGCLQELTVTLTRLYDILDHFTSYTNLPIAPILYLLIVLTILVLFVFLLIVYIVLNKLRRNFIREARLLSNVQEL